MGEGAAPIELVGPQQIGVIANLGSLGRHAGEQQAGAQVSDEEPCTRPGRS